MGSLPSSLPLLDFQTQILAAKHFHDQSPPSLSKSPVTSYALAKPVCFSLPPFPVYQPVRCDSLLVQATFRSWLYNCDSLQQSPSLLFFALLQIYLLTSARLIFTKVNNAHPFLKILCGMWHSTTQNKTQTLPPRADRAHNDPAPAYLSKFLLHLYSPHYYSHTLSLLFLALAVSST